MSKARRFSPSARWTPVALVLGAMGLAAALVLPRLGDRLFWDDEANTAIYARNLLRFHRITAWDGDNLCGYGLGGALGEDLGQELRVPTLPAYLAAASMAILGPTTFAGRLPFALAGVVSVGLLAVWLRCHFGRRFPWYLPSLIMAVSPALLLYSRNCRYYALGLMFSLAVLALWAPGDRRPGQAADQWLSRGELWRWVGAATAFLLLLGAHYLNAAALLAVLPLMFLDRRYRQRRQVALFGVLVIAAAVGGVWALATANPFKAHYEIGQTWLFASPAIPDRWTRFSWNMGWFLRNLGSHEFVPWLLLPVLLLPLVPWRKAARQRPLAWRGAVLAGMVLGYTLVAALAIPPDMGKGPAAEMRYVVPLIAFGAVLGGLALTLLWRTCRPAAIPLAALLIGTNWLFLGGTVPRYDRANSWWPPTLYCYLHELRFPIHAGDEELIELLDRLPAGTTVRIWPSFMAYPPMYYVPKLHYCDQLTENKPLRPELRDSLPDYLFVERAQPEVVVVPAAHLGEAMEHLERTIGPGKYRVCKALHEYFGNYTAKPEIPMHWFRVPEGDWSLWPGAIVLVAAGSEAERSAALASDGFDRRQGAFALCAASKKSVDVNAALEYCEAALRLCPTCAAAHINLGVLCESRKRFAEAIGHFRAAIAADPTSEVAHYDLANRLRDENEFDEAEQHYLKALALKPVYAPAHFNLGVMLLRQGRTAEAREHLAIAERNAPPGYPLAEQVRRILKQLPK